MRDFKTAVAVILISFILLFISPSSTWAADDPAAMFQSKCAVCHGTDGLANTPLGKKQSIPSFANEKVQRSPNTEIADMILNGGKDKRPSHSFAGKGITQDDAVRLATYIKMLGKKK